MKTLKPLGIVLVLGVALTLISMLIANLLAIPFVFTWLEFAAVSTSYACTLLCVIQSRLNYPIGIVTTFLYSILFFQWELYAVALFNLYLVFSLIYGWFRWGPDGKSIKVTNLKLDKWLFGYVGLGAGIYLLLTAITAIFGVEMGALDIIIAVLSGVAQFLLDNKRLQTWHVWIVVNVLSIYLYFQTGLMLAALQYVFFLGNAFVGLHFWKKSMRIEK